MKKLKAFAYVFKNSALRPKYYKQVLKAPFKFSLKYFLAFFFLLTFFTVITLSIFLIQKGYPFLTQVKTQAPQLYPAELEINIKDGLLTINQPEPYFIPLKADLFPEEIKKGLNNQPIQNIIVIDTQAQATDIRAYQTFALLTQTDVAFFGDQGEIRVQSLEEIKDFTLNRQLINDLWIKIIPYFSYIIPGLIALMILFLPALTILGQFIYLLLFSITAWIVARLWKNKEIDYKKALQINLHAITLPALIVILFQALGVQPQIPFFRAIILLIFNLLIFSALREKSK